MVSEQLIEQVVNDQKNYSVRNWRHILQADI